LVGFLKITTLVVISNSALFVLSLNTTKVEHHMWIEIVMFITTFIISTALAVIGIMVAYEIYQTHKKPVLQILLYHQIFLISFFVYGIWGNIALHEILSDLNLGEELSKKLTVFIPMLGSPFLIVSWFMLIRFGFLLNGYANMKKFAWFYFPILIVLILGFSVLVHNNIIGISDKPDLFIVRAIVILNLLFHVIFIFPFLIEKKEKPLQKEVKFLTKHALLYLTGVIIYSIALWFYNFFGSISTCISILLLFATSISIQLVLKLKEKTQILPQKSNNMDFKEFCSTYEISKRESEIVLEICSGKTNKAISEKLFITLQTVKDHNYRIYAKLGVKTRIQLTNLVREKTGL
jgi:DNA-binding CsgD family transcriptional regulator